VARIHTNTVAIAIVFMISIEFVRTILVPVKKIEVNNLIIKILAYSAIKISANILLLYSTLNPETNSDSPSAKSKGVRFVSAKLVINHIKNRGEIISIIHDIMFIDMIDMSIW
jgi:hypothetical protein